MGHIKINGINLAFKISVSIGDNTNVMQTVDPDEQFNQSAVGIAVKYLSIVLWVGRAITAFSLTLSTREEKLSATITLPRWRKIARFREHFNTRLAYYYFAKYMNLSGTNF